MSSKDVLLQDIDRFRQAIEKFCEAYLTTIAGEPSADDPNLILCTRIDYALGYTKERMLEFPELSFGALFFQLSESLAYIYCHNAFVDEKHKRHYAPAYNSALLNLIDKYQSELGIPSVKQFKKYAAPLLGKRSSSLQTLEHALGEYELRLHDLREEEESDNPHPIDDIEHAVAECHTQHFPERLQATRTLFNAATTFLAQNPNDPKSHTHIQKLQNILTELIDYLEITQSD